jgi:hypothetical protein
MDATTTYQLLQYIDRLTFNIEQLARVIERDANLRHSPCQLYKPRVFRDGDKWCALYGDDLQVGVSGHGRTPEEATRQFDENWFKFVAIQPQPTKES